MPKKMACDAHNVSSKLHSPRTVSRAPYQKAKAKDKYMDASENPKPAPIHMAPRRPRAIGPVSSARVGAQGQAMAAQAGGARPERTGDGKLGIQQQCTRPGGPPTDTVPREQSDTNVKESDGQRASNMPPCHHSPHPYLHCTHVVRKNRWAPSVVTARMLSTASEATCPAWANHAWDLASVPDMTTTSTR